MKRKAATDEGKRDIDAELIACIKFGLRVVPDMQAELKLSRGTVDAHLRGLEDAGQVHRVKVRNMKGGYINHWLLGSGEDAVDPIETPNIILTPANAIIPVIGRRDPLVAAIHGPARRYAALCTACGVEQGTQHARGCIVALVAA